jgi:hypothetical protein
VAEFLPRHLKEKHGRPQAIAEYLYSLVYACSKHLYCPHLNLFMKVLLDEVEDTLREEHQELVAQLASALSNHEQDKQSKTNAAFSGWVSKSDFKAITLQTLHSSKDLPLLWELLEVDMDQGLVCYDELLEPDASGLTSAFVDSLLEHLIEARLAFFCKLEDSVYSLGQPQVTPRLLADAVEGLDMSGHQTGVLSLVSRVFDGKGGSDPNQPVVSSLEEALRMIRIRRPLADGSDANINTLLAEGQKKAKPKKPSAKKK